MMLAAGDSFVDWDDVETIESIGTAEDGRTIYAWLRLRDGRGALWQFELGKPPGQPQRATVIPGA
jgi:hypothetical protein